MFLRMTFGVYFFFASLMLCSAVFVYFFVPETKGVPLEAMDKLFDVSPARAANAKVFEDLRIEDEEFRANAEGAGLSTNKKEYEQVESV